MKRKLIRFIILLICLPVVYLLCVILFGTITDYKPSEKEVISQLEDEITVSDSAVFSALIYNIGYCGLGAEMDFFYDGGTKVRDSEDNTRRNLYKITDWLRQNDTIDFMLLQEVDLKSRRSYTINQVENFNLNLASHFPFFTLNYKAKFVPVPFTKPMGSVKSGLLSLSRYVPVSSIRYSFPGNYAWPKNTFMLDRCFLVNRYKLESGKELLIINTHNSAYDDGTLRSQQKTYLKKFLEAEAEKGNYIIVGGDWNECPPGFKPEFEGHVFDTTDLYFIDKNYMPENWKWCFDKTEPTNRRVITAYMKGKCPVTLIDFFLVSPNIEVVKCKGINTEFNYSDHQPVVIQFKLRE